MSKKKRTKTQKNKRHKTLFGSHKRATKKCKTCGKVHDKDHHRKHKHRSKRINPKKKAGYSPKARRFLSREIKHLVRDKGYSPKRAVGAAFDMARSKGLKVPPRPNPREFIRVATKEALHHKKGRGRKPSEPHKAKRGACPKCSLLHSAHEHAAHGKNAHCRTHGGCKPRKNCGKTPCGKRKKNPGPALLLHINPSSRETKWRDLPAAIKKNPEARAVALKVARRNGVPLGDVIFERTDKIPAGMSRFQAKVGDLVAEEYVPGRKSSLAFARGRGRYRHTGGDHGRGKKKTRPVAKVWDPRTGLTWDCPQKGSRREFSSRVGLKG